MSSKTCLITKYKKMNIHVYIKEKNIYPGHKQNSVSSFGPLSCPCPTVIMSSGGDNTHRLAVNSHLVEKKSKNKENLPSVKSLPLLSAPLTVGGHVFMLIVALVVAIHPPVVVVTRSLSASKI